MIQSIHHLLLLMLLLRYPLLHLLDRWLLSYHVRLVLLLWHHVLLLRPHLWLLLRRLLELGGWSHLLCGLPKTIGRLLQSRAELHLLLVAGRGYHWLLGRLERCRLSEP